MNYKGTDNNNVVDWYFKQVNHEKDEVVLGIIIQEAVQKVTINDNNSVLKVCLQPELGNIETVKALFDEEADDEQNAKVVAAMGGTVLDKRRDFNTRRDLKKRSKEIYTSEGSDSHSHPSSHFSRSQSPHYDDFPHHDFPHHDDYDDHLNYH